MNELLLQLIDELTRSERQEPIFDSPSSRLPPNYLFRLQPDGCDPHYASSVSSLSEPDASTQRVREALVSGARTLSNNLKRLFHGGSGSPASGLSKGAIANPDASASRGPRPLLAQSADEAHQMLASDSDALVSTATDPGPQLLLPPPTPVSGGRLELRWDAGTHPSRPSATVPPEVDPLGQ
ncbi:unnamed protein product [Schistocephalus solidus]|uniref:Uncharacterized protein n=1 Tax=Schistocephalus solidus TaxID=70667 RepID=A0A3P7CRT1_SCHSO|nr:unnamed protein product [Schistocephalus solidus]